MADDDNPEISGFAEVSVGYNYIKLSLAPLAMEVGLSAELNMNAGNTFTVKLGGDYSTVVLGIKSEAWLAGIAKMEYAAAGSTEISVDGNPITLKTAVAENGGTAASLHSAGARILAAGMNQASRLARTRARAVRTQSSGVGNTVGGVVSTGGTN